MECRIVVDVFGVVFDEVEVEDAALAWTREVSNALGARGGALPDIAEDDDDVGENKRDSALTTTTTLGVVSHATPQRTISVRRKGGNTQSTEREQDPGPVFLRPERRRCRREFVDPFARLRRHTRTVCQVGKTAQVAADGVIGHSCPRKVGLLFSPVIMRDGFLTGREQDTLSVRGGVSMVRIVRSPGQPSPKLQSDPCARLFGQGFRPFDQRLRVVSSEYSHPRVCSRRYRSR